MFRKSTDPPFSVSAWNLLFSRHVKYCNWPDRTLLRIRDPETGFPDLSIRSFPKTLHTNYGSGTVKYDTAASFNATSYLSFRITLLFDAV